MKTFRVLLLLAFLGSLVFYLYYEIHHVEVKRYVVRIANLPEEFDGFTILHMTDLHSKWFGDKQQDLLKIIKSQRYDMVAVTGDLVDRHNPDIAPALVLLDALKDKPIFLVSGNHDWATGFALREPLKARGIVVLENNSQKVEKDGASIEFIGIEGNFYTGNRILDETLARIGYSEATKNGTKILLAHMPDIFPHARRRKMDLVLAGHTHGGQIRLPIIGAVVAPNQGFFPKYDYGKFQEGSATMIISGGLGESTIPIRVMNPPEIVLVTLTSGN